MNTKKNTACIICGSFNREFWYRGGAVRRKWRDGQSWSVFTCKDCGHGCTDPQPDAETLRGYYSKGYGAYEFQHGIGTDFANTVTQAKAQGEYRHVKVTPGMRILDIGCGGGSFLAVCRELGARVQGVEPSSEGAATCRAANVPVFEGSLTLFLQQNDEKFDLITANHVVEHHPNPPEFISEMRSILMPEGTIWISVPNAGCFFSRKLKSKWHSADLPVHLHHFSIASIKRLFSSANLHIDSIRTESENSLCSSLSELLRQRFFIPGRVSYLLFSNLLKKDGLLGKRLDTSGNGEAILLSAKNNDPIT